jgi:hypothetical protein
MWQKIDGAMLPYVSAMGHGNSRLGNVIVSDVNEESNQSCYKKITIGIWQTGNEVVVMCPSPSVWQVRGGHICG